MIYYSTNELPLKEEKYDYIFLAGSIDLDLSSDWRQEVIKDIHADKQIHFFNPTIGNHNALDDLQMKTHIQWELHALEMADHILLNFLPEAKSPISLVELGLYAKTNKLMVVCPVQFYQNRYVNELCSRYNIPCYTRLDKAIERLSDIELI